MSVNDSFFTRSTIIKKFCAYYPPHYTGRIFRAQRNFSLFESSQAELIEKRQRKIVLCGGPGGKQPYDYTFYICYFYDHDTPPEH